MQRYEFNGFFLDAGRRLLFNPNGKPIPLKPKVFDTLVYLVENAGQLLEKAALMNAVWGSVIVEENSLNQHVSTLRKVLGEAPGEHRFIVTVPGKGYRFVADVRTVAAEGSEPQLAAPAVPFAHRRGVQAVAAMLVILAAGGGFIYTSSSPRVAPVRSIAVLPLANLSDDPDKAVIALGFHDEIITQLSKLDLPVTPRAEVMQYADTKLAVEELGRVLNVDAIVEGTFRYADDRLRVSVSLVDTRTKKMLWRDQYDRSFADILAIESDIASNVGGELKARLEPTGIATLAEGTTLDARAYGFYYSARDYRRRGIVNTATAIGLLEKAVAQDSDYALAWAELAHARALQYRWLQPSPQLLDGAREAAETALHLSPGLAMGRVAMSFYESASGSAEPAEILRKLNLVESKSHRIPEFFAMRADLYETLGLWKEAVADFATASALEPRNVPDLLALGHGYLTLRRYDEAEKAFARAEDTEPDDPGMRFHRASLYLFRDADTSKLRAMDAAILERRLPNAPLNTMAALFDGDFDTALKMLELWPDAEALPQRNNLRFAKPLWYAHVYAFAGRTADAKPFFDTARARIEQRLADEPGDPGLRLALASVLAMADGQNERAIETIRGAVEQIDRLPPLVAMEMRLDAAFAFANAGAVELAVDQLDRYLSNPGEWSIEGLLRYPDLAGLRADARFLELVKKHGRATAHL